MRVLFATLICLWILPAQAQDAGQLAAALQASSQVQSNCPALVSASIGTPSDRSTWKAAYASSPNSACQIATANVIADFQTPPTFVTLTSTGTPALNGNYAIDATTQMKIQAISIYVAVNGRFPNSQSTQAWPDTSGTIHKFISTTQWLAFATAMGDFITALDLGQSPSNSITIL